MDYEKLIERLRHDANAYRNGDTLGRAYADQAHPLDLRRPSPVYLRSDRR